MSTLLDLKEVAKRLSVHYGTARELVLSGKLRGIRLGGRRHIQVLETDLEAFIEESAIGPITGPKVHEKRIKMAPNDRGQKSQKPRPHEWRKAFRAK